MTGSTLIAMLSLSAATLYLYTSISADVALRQKNLFAEFWRKTNMDLFTDICLMIVPSALVWHFFFLFCADDSRYQKHRLRKAIENINSYITANTPSGHAPIEFNIIHKNKKFSIGIIVKEMNDRYYTYDIYINGDQAATYHRLRHLTCSSYYFEEVNRRHKGEVISIILAANKALKQREKPKKEKTDGYSEYSYFK
jgi:hypothetical protein